MITIATNMAGRGTDIVLGGRPDAPDWQALHDQVLAAGGLHIIGTERHESRRIDNQLRGRAGRQGDPGSSRFYLSMDDPLLRIFAGERMKSIMARLGVPRGEPIEAGMVSRSIESAQRKVENRNFEIRKQLLEYDNVANEQRQMIYAQRNEVLESEDLNAFVGGLRHGALTTLARLHVPMESIEEQWDLPSLEQALREQYRLEVPLVSLLETEDELDDDDLVARVCEAADKAYQDKLGQLPPGVFLEFERSVLLQHIDAHWREHLAALDHLRQGIHLRGYAQKDPKQEYKREAFGLFEQLLGRVRDDVTRTLLNVQVATEEEVAQAAQAAAPAEPKAVSYTHADFEGAPLADDAGATPELQPESEPSVPTRRSFPKVGRNDPCPCGSGKKYKLCHGALS
jgi:preprotein translocase subunit SecA